MTAQNSKRTLAFQRSEMLSLRDEGNNAGHKDQPAPSRTLLRRLADRFARFRARYAAIAVLRRTSDRELRDMGITRADIGRVFDATFADEYARRGLPPVKPRRSGGAW